MSEQQQSTLVPIEEKAVDFYGDEITAALVKTGDESEIYVPIRPIVEYLGLSFAGQRERINRHPVLSKAVKGVRVTRTPSLDKRSAGGPQEMLCLPLEQIPGWLFGIDASRVKPELQSKIIRYQEEAFKVLWRAFQAEALDLGERAGVSVTPTAPVKQPNSLSQIRDMGLAIAQLAEQQMALEEQVDEAGRLAADAHTRLDKAAQVVKNLTERIGEVEKKLAPPVYISEAQAAEISNRVKAVAQALGGKEKGRNQYAAIFAELYRRFEVTSYKRIRQGQFEAVMNFLDSWAENQGGDPKPRQGNLFD